MTAFNPVSRLARRVSYHDRINADRRQIIIGRVKDVITDPNHDKFNEYGQYDAIGTVFFDYVDRPSYSVTDKLPTARPLDSTSRKYPLRDELILILYLGDLDILEDESLSYSRFFYVSILNLWNSVHHNIVFSDAINSSTTFKDLGITNYSIKEGDTTLDGRYGNSIILTSDSNYEKPLTIIVNGQYKEEEQNFEQQVDFKRNGSTIILSESTVESIDEYRENSFKTLSIPRLKSYDSSQLQLLSDRLVMSTKKEDIILNSKSNIHISSQNTNYITSDKTVVDSEKVHLGTENASDPLILSNDFLRDIKDLCQKISSFADIAKSLVSKPPGVPYVELTVPSVNLKVSALKILNSIENYKSKKVYTS